MQDVHSYSSFVGPSLDKIYRLVLGGPEAGLITNLYIKAQTGMTKHRQGIGIISSVVRLLRL